MLRNKTNKYTHIYVLSRRTKEGEAMRGKHLTHILSINQIAMRS